MSLQFFCPVSNKTVHFILFTLLHFKNSLYILDISSGEIDGLQMFSLPGGCLIYHTLEGSLATKFFILVNSTFSFFNLKDQASCVKSNNLLPTPRP